MEIRSEPEVKYEKSQIAEGSTQRSAIVASREVSVYTVVADVSTAFDVGLEDQRGLALEVSCGPDAVVKKDLVLAADQAVASGVVKVNERLEFKHTAQYGEKPQSLPDVFVKLLRGKEAVLFVRLGAYQFHNTARERYAVYPFIVDRSLDSDLPDHKAGYLRCRLGIFSNRDKQATEAPKAPQTWQRPNPSPVVTKICLVANLFRAVNLPSADDDGLSDPYLEFYHHGSRFNSDVCQKVLDPVWNDRVVIETHLYDNTLLPLVVKVFDLDARSGDRATSDFLGFFFVDDLPAEPTGLAAANRIPKPRWYEVSYSHKLKMGHVLLSFQLFEHSPDLGSRLADIELETTAYKVKFKLLGLRDLESSGVIPVKKPYVKMNISPLKGERHVSSDFDIITANSKAGSSVKNANLAEVIVYARLTQLRRGAPGAPVLPADRHCRLGLSSVMCSTVAHCS